MTPNELRIGNYVRIKDTGEIVCVCAITKHKVGFHAPNERPNAQLRYRRFYEIDPVLIHDVQGALEPIQGLMWVDKRTTFDESVNYSYMYHGREITVLHELQNFHYAFTGKEIEIKL